MRRGSAIRPSATNNRRVVVAVLLVFAACSALSLVLSIRATSRSEDRGTEVEVAARQRTLAERYVENVLLRRAGRQADPGETARVLTTSAHVLIGGGVAPSLEGDDDATRVRGVTDPVARAQLAQASRLAAELTATGRAILAHDSVTAVPLHAGESALPADPVERLRALAGLTSNGSLNAARTIATGADRNVNHLVSLQALLGIGGTLVSLLLGATLMVASRRQTAHFRSLVMASSDLVLVFGAAGCRYASPSVARLLGVEPDTLTGSDLEDHVHPDDRSSFAAARAHGEPRELVFRVRSAFGDWRHLEAHVSDLRRDRDIRGVVFNARDVTERIRLEEELSHQAVHDGLTGLANRALFRDRLDQGLARAARDDTALAVLLLDVDGFKRVNDTLGHQAGDDLLRDVAGRLAHVARPGDTLARLGGDEFALIVESTDEAHAADVAQKMLDAVRPPGGGSHVALGASIGVAVHRGAGGRADELLRRADLAMYAAKESGRGRFEVFEEAMARELGDAVSIERELQHALEREELVLAYQLEYDVADERIVGAEALMRWSSPTRGPVPPSTFIPVAESSGAIVPLGELALRMACRQTAAWEAAGLLADDFTTWVNVSAVQLSAGGLADTVERTLAVSGLAPGRLGLEVTETAIVAAATADQARAELQRLHERGVRIAIDDFGTGFSALGQLRRFPIDVLKVDRSFVQGLEEGGKDAAIVTNLVTLAHALGLAAVAEGVETPEQLAALRELGCDLAQGFLLARPEPPDAVSERLRATAAPALA